MRIIIKSNIQGDTRETVLCDGPGRGLDLNIGPLDDGVVIEDVVTAQSVEFLRAAAGKAYNRGNQRTSLSFRIARECSSALAAHTWQVAFHSSCLRSGTLRLTETTATGSRKEVRIENAVITAIRSTPRGVTRFVEFTIIGGPLKE